MAVMLGSQSTSNPGCRNGVSSPFHSPDLTTTGSILYITMQWLCTACTPIWHLDNESNKWVLFDLRMLWSSYHRVDTLPHPPVNLTKLNFLLYIDKCTQKYLSPDFTWDQVIYTLPWQFTIGHLACSTGWRNVYPPAQCVHSVILKRRPLLWISP